ncbi:378_t:CDS:2, partial [Racocetra persica]
YKCFHYNGLNPNIVSTFPNKLRTLNIKNIQVVEVKYYYLSHHNTTLENQGSSTILLKAAESLRVMIKK